MTTLALPYRLLNVFTCAGDPLSGNPLCVFERGEGLKTETMQRLARQFNLSETTFVLPASSPHARARVRIFTPSYEMPFAGHPTLGSAAVVRSLGLGGDRLVLELAAGMVPVEAQGDRWTLSATLAGTRELDIPRAQLARLLALEEPDIAERPLWVTTGTEQLMVPLTSTEALRRVAPGAAIFDVLAGCDGPAKVYVFVQQNDGSTAGAGVPAAPRKVSARFFFPQGKAVLEDPATGSAAANLGGWWLAQQRPLPLLAVISQGEQVGRPSRLYLSVGDLDAAAGRVHVGGDVVELGRGTVTIPNDQHHA